MNIDNLKVEWGNIGSNQKSPKELLMMTKINNHPNIKRMKIRFMIEAVALIAFIVLYYDAFDGTSKPLWANILLIGAASVYIITRFSGWLLLRNPVKENNLKQSLQLFQKNLKRKVISIILTSFLFGTAVIIFFTSVIDFTKGKYIVLFFMVLIFICLIYLSIRNWIKKIKIINKTLEELDGNDLV